MPEQDRFDKARESLAGTPGYQRRASTVMSDPISFMPGATWIIETMRNKESWTILIQSIDGEGGRRLVIPTRVAETIYRHYDSIIKTSKSLRSQTGAETRKKKKEKQEDK
jgi:hypothetical protein